jgi:F-type H+-transporting ATPase subunit delta
MMNDSMTAEITTPYAQALMAIAKDANAADQVGQEVSDLLEVLDSSEELSTFLMNPLMTAEPKKGVLRQIAEGKVSPFLLSFLLLLVDRGRVPW